MTPEQLASRLRDVEAPICDQAAAELRRLADENAALKADAERWNWFILQMLNPEPGRHDAMFSRLRSINPDPCNIDEVNEAIDAAMQKDTP
jgi:hypothetical protein